MKRGALKFVLFSLVFCAYYFLIPSIAIASDAQTGLSIIISEVMYNPEGLEGEEEWLEIYNQSTDEVDISGFLLRSNNDSDYTILDGTTLPAEGFLVFAKDESAFKSLYAEEVAHFYNLSLSLANSGDYIELVSREGEVVSFLSWGNVEYSGGTCHQGVAEGGTLDRIDYDQIVDTCFDAYFSNNSPTPGRKYEKVDYSHDIIITEVVPRPKEGSEFEYIELYNAGDSDISLSGWLLDDVSEGGSSPYVIDDLVIKAYEYIFFYKTETSLSLNDSGDTVQLLTPDGQVVSQVLYQEAKSNQSYSLIENTWLWSLEMTPGEVNIYKEKVSLSNSQTYQRVSLYEAKKLPLSSLVEVEGRVVVLPKVLSDKYFYIDDITTGIQVYFYDEAFPVLKLGDRIVVRGEISEAYGEKRIKISQKSDISYISSGEKPEPVAVLKPPDLKDKEGKMVKVVGKVTETSGSTFYVDEIKVIIKEQTGINKPRMQKGDLVQVQGVVTQYKGEYRILPTAQDDVILLSSKTLPRAGPGYLLVIFSALCAYILTVRKKLIILLKRLPKNFALVT